MDDASEVSSSKKYCVCFVDLKFNLLYICIKILWFYYQETFVFSYTKDDFHFDCSNTGSKVGFANCLLCNLLCKEFILQ